MSVSKLASKIDVSRIITKSSKTYKECFVILMTHR